MRVNRAIMMVVVAVVVVVVVVVASLLSVALFSSGNTKAFADKPTLLDIGQFSANDPNGDIPPGWEPLNFKRIKKHTAYRLVNDNGTTVVRATSDASASGLIRKIRIDPRKYPIIEWRWKAMKIYEKGDVTSKSGDDYPARIYIAFEYNPEKVGFFERATFRLIKMLYGEFPPINAITYIWASHAAKSTIVPNAYTNKEKMIVVESGVKNTGSWVSESRNIFDDYRTAFGSDPPMIRGIAIMTDSDNTGESAQTFYGDIIMKSFQ